MDFTIGFILLTHNKPDQIIRLMSTLNRLFYFPPIVCHHDFSKSILPEDRLTSNISLVTPYLETGWSKFSVVEATLSALRMMYQSSKTPDWFILLSGADYPIKPANHIINDLKSSLYDVHMHYEKIEYGCFERDWQRLCYDRYCGKKFMIPWINRKFKLSKGQIVFRHPFFSKQFHPFSEAFPCFAGEHWFCANRKAANYLLDFHNDKSEIASYYQSLDPYTVVPEESYYHSIFCNAQNLKVSQNHWRYIDWSGGGSHPKTLGIDDLIKIKNSPAHFARKFDADKDKQVLSHIDEFI